MKYKICGYIKKMRSVLPFDIIRLTYESITITFLKRFGQIDFMYLY